MDPLYPDAELLGRNDARDMIDKGKPRSSRDLVMIKRILVIRAEKKYGDYVKGCRVSYITGVENELRKQFTKIKNEKRVKGLWEIFGE